MNNPLEVIVEYEMDSLEAKAYKLCVIWDALVRKEFPNELFTALRTKGDPRKSNLFRYCYKLIRETLGLIPDEQYRLYITAQLHVLRLQKDGDVHALIDPCILVGDKAWKRWKLWKKYYDRQRNQHKTEEELDIKDKMSRIQNDLKRTKQFLASQEIVSQEGITEKINDLSLIRWISLGKVTPYYAILSPWISSAVDGKNLEEVFLFDLGVYRKSINDEVTNWFREEFAYEF